MEDNIKGLSHQNMVLDVCFVSNDSYHHTINKSIDNLDVILILIANTDNNNHNNNDHNNSNHNNNNNNDKADDINPALPTIRKIP